GVIGAANICSYGRNEQGAGSFLYEPSLTLTVNLFPATPEQFGPQRPQSSSASRFTAGAFGFGRDIFPIQPAFYQARGYFSWDCFSCWFYSTNLVFRRSGSVWPVWIVIPLHRRQRTPR